jgi:hypothetical protein
VGDAVSTEWLVAKYIPDLRRREPRNIGVILRMGGQQLARFIGERAPGSVDGRSLRGRVADVQTYKAWVDYWRHAMLEAASLRDLVMPSTDESYVVEYGGARLLGSEGLPPTDMLEHLYAALVEELPERSTMSVAELSESVLRLAGIADDVTRGYPLDIEHDTFSDRVVFDYRYVNGRSHLFQQVSLTFADERSWTLAHAAAWSFEKASAIERTTSLVALVNPRQRDADLERQLLLLEEHASVIDVAEPESAAYDLRELISVT